MNPEMLEVYFVIAIFILYLVLWMIKRRELFKSTGVNANVLASNKRPTQRYFGALERIMTSAIVLILIAHILLPANFLFTTRLFGKGLFAFDMAGGIVALLGLLLCRIAQVTMNKSWRVGIDEEAKPGLIQHGIYKIIRNPTYSGMFLMCIGIYIILPTPLLLYWILLFFIMMEFQVRCEEEYLQKTYGDEYRQYCKLTKRYIPFVY